MAKFWLIGVAVLACSGLSLTLTMEARVASDAARVPNFAPDDSTGWVPARPEGDESRRGIGKQLGIGHAERRSHHDDSGGENQHRIMVDEMGGVDEADHPAGAVHGLVPGYCLPDPARFPCRFPGSNPAFFSNRL